VRVLGLPPHADELQFIDFERIQNARKNQVEVLGMSRWSRASIY
jgi:hypothetical protein